MLTTEDLLMFYHFSNELVNQAIAQKVIQDFEKNILGESIDWEIGEKDLNMECLEIQKVLNIINTWGYDKNYSEKVFNLLARYGFRMNLVMIDAMESLGKLENPNRNKETIATFLNTPFIDDVSFNGNDSFTIISEKLGNLTFCLANIYFKNYAQIMEYINKKRWKKYCHQHTEFLAKILPEFYSITSLCDYYFKGSYYHSYSYNKEENVAIDLCSNAVLDVDKFNYFYGVQEIMRIPNKEIDDFYLSTLKNTHQPAKRFKIFKIALYEQLKQFAQEENLLLKK